MVSCADDNMGATASDWLDCADAFLLGRIGGHLAVAGAALRRGSPLSPVCPQFVVRRPPPR